MAAPISPAFSGTKIGGVILGFRLGRLSQQHTLASLTRFMQQVAPLTQALPHRAIA